MLNSISNVTRFIDKVKWYTEITEQSDELLNVFIEKIEFGERAERCQNGRTGNHYSLS